MIIVEGPDGAGKTTLIRQLQTRYDIDVMPRVVSKDTEAMVDLKKWVEEDLAKGFRYTLFDRYRLISEFIYGPVLRTKQHEGFTDFGWVGDKLSQFRRVAPIVIYCLPPLEVVKANVQHDDDNSVVADKIEAIYAGYIHRYALDTLAAINPLVWDFTAGTPLNVFDSAFQFAKSRSIR